MKRGVSLDAVLWKVLQARVPERRVLFPSFWEGPFRKRWEVVEAGGRRVRMFLERKRKRGRPVTVVKTISAVAAGESVVGKVCMARKARRALARRKECRAGGGSWR